ncbi:MAG: hypothetical protein IJ813_06515, partial [Bacteroidales bacterium]|nr:hypothetical protein [Bacteroidales bacterium]
MGSIPTSGTRPESFELFEDSGFFVVVGGLKIFANIENLCTFASALSDYPLQGGYSPKSKGVSALTEMPFF